MCVFITVPVCNEGKIFITVSSTNFCMMTINRNTKDINELSLGSVINTCHSDKGVVCRT